MDDSISIPTDLRRKLEAIALDRGISVEDLVRTTLEDLSSPKLNDPLFRDSSVFKGDVPVDGAANHDDYLYGDAS